MRLKFKADWSSVDWSKSDGLIAEELGCSRTPVFRARREFAPDTVRPPPDFSNVNWTKTNQQIADELGTTYSNVAAQRSLQGHSWEGKRARHMTRTIRLIKNKLMSLDCWDEKLGIIVVPDDRKLANMLVDELLGTSATQHLKDKLRFNPKTLTFKAVL